MIIKKLEFKFTETDNFTTVPLRQYSGLMNNSTDDTEAGKIYKTDITCYIANILKAKEDVLELLVSRPVIIRVTDTRNVVFEIGNDNEKCRADYNQKIGPTPGVAHGWDLSITGVFTSKPKTTIPENTSGWNIGEAVAEDENISQE